MKGDIEDVKHELALLLQAASFLTLLTAVDLEKGTSVVTPGPAVVFEGEKANLTGQGYPVCEVIGLRTVYEAASDQTKTATHDVQVSWTQVGDDELTITTQVERLVRATRDLLWPHDGPINLPALASAPIELVSEEYSELFKGKDVPFVKGSMTVLRVTTFSL